jgi:hypothetical protein
LHRIQKHFLTSIKWNCRRGYVCFQYLNAWKQSGYLKPPGCKLLIMGLPGSGKTTLARTLAPMINAVHFNADEVRAHLNKDLGYSVADRIEQATRMGWLCDQIVKAGMVAIADFVCPTRETRTAFKAGGNAFVVWIDRIDRGDLKIPIACSRRQVNSTCGFGPQARRNTGRSRLPNNSASITGRGVRLSLSACPISEARSPESGTGATPAPSLAGALAQAI